MNTIKLVWLIQTQTFTLDEGMSSGLDDIRLSISYFCKVQTQQKKASTYNKDFGAFKIQQQIELLSVNVCSLVLDIRYEEQN